MLQLVGGVSTILPMNYVEYVWFFFVVLIGTVLFAAIQGIICGVVTNGDPDETEWVQKNDRLNAMMADTKVPQQVKMFVRAHFRKAKRLRKRQSYDTLIDECLSTELQGDVRYYMCQTLFARVWYLADCDRSFLEELSVRVSRESFAVKEQIECNDTLIVLTQGVVVRGGMVLGVPSYFGDIILSSHVLRDTTPAKALTYVEVAKLTRHDLYEVLALHPEAEKQVKDASLKLAIQRTILLTSVYAKLHPEAAKEETPADIMHKLLAPGEWNEVVEEEGKRRTVTVSTAAKPVPAGQLSVEEAIERVNAAPPETQQQVFMRVMLERQDAMMNRLVDLEARTQADSAFDA
jgi:hypothetical protein